MTKNYTKTSTKSAPAKRRRPPTRAVHAECSRKRTILKSRFALLEARVNSLETVFGKTFSLGVDVVELPIKGKVK